MGRLTANPELKTTSKGGISVTSFTVAVNRRIVAKDTEQQADFINIVAWRKTAEFICKYFSKGNMIALDGSIQTRNYEDKSGNKRTAFEVVADNVYFTGSKSENNSPKFAVPADGDDIDFEEVVPDEDGELPFE